MAPPSEPPSRSRDPRAAPAPRWTGQQRALIALAKWLAPPLIAALGSTLDLQLPEDLPPEARTEPPQPAIYAFWHCCLLPIAWCMRHRGIGILVSQHFDGEWIAQAAARMGYVIFRGSSTRGGREALFDMQQALLRGTPIGFTVDGPRGPRYQAKPGPVYLARLTGMPLYAVHVEMKSAWTLNSWDGLQIPKPGSIMRGVWRGPFHIRPDASPQELERARQELETTLNYLREEASSALGS